MYENKDIRRQKNTKQELKTMPTLFKDTMFLKNFINQL